MNSLIHKLSRKSLEALIQAFEYISSPLNPDEILKLVLEQISNLLNAEAGSIFLLNPKSKELELKVATNLTKEEIDRIKVPYGKGLAGFVAEKDQVVNIHDVSKDDRFYSNIDSLTGFKTKNILTVPLKTSERIIGVIQALNKKDNHLFTEEDEILLVEFARLVGLTLEKAWLHSQLLEKQIIETDLKIASQIQESLLPKTEIQRKDIFVKGYYKPARFISGDYYDYFPLSDNEILIVLGDVAGKGAQASLIMASVKAYLSSAIESKIDFISMSNNLNKFLVKNTPLDKFITIFLALINFQKDEITYINSGHEPGLIISPENELVKLNSNNLMMGILEDFEYIPTTLHFPENSFLFVYTDGVTESNNTKDERFGDQRLLEILLANKYEPLKIFSELPDKIEKFAAGQSQFDDITMLMIINGEKLIRQ